MNAKNEPKHPRKVDQTRARKQSFTEQIRLENEAIICTGKRLIREALAALHIEKPQEIKQLHEVLDDLLRENERLGGNTPQKPEDSLESILKELRQCRNETI